jgi:hypothetical protein
MSYWKGSLMKEKQTNELFHYRPEQALGFPRFQTSRHMKVEKLSALHTGRVYSQEIPSTHFG